MRARKKARILQLVNGELYGGAERVQEMILKLINKDLFETYCVSLMDGAFVKKAWSKGLPIEVISMRNKLDFRVIFKIANFVKRKNINLIHTHTVRTNLVGRFVGEMKKVPVVTHVHSTPLYETTNPIRSRFNQIVERVTRCLSDHFICVSHSLKLRLIAEGIPASKVRVIHNGVEINRFSSNPSSPCHHNQGLKVKKRLGLDPESKIILMMALFRPLKGTENLIEAMSQVVPKFPEVCCLLVGGFEKKNYKKRIETLVHTLKLKDKVLFLGFEREISPILKAADVVVLPSLFGEGLPLVILEAMAMGKPVIATPVGGIPEIVIHKETGFLVPAGDSEELAKAIINMLKDYKRASELGIKAQKVVREKNTAKVMVKKIEQVYQKVLNYS